MFDLRSRQGAEPERRVSHWLTEAMSPTVTVDSSLVTIERE